MVLKTSRPGHDGLNTGRTLRGSGRVLGRRYAFLRCSTTGPAPIDRAQLSDRLDILDAVLPPDGVEYSLNKKGRWKVADIIKDELLSLADEADWQVRLLEHHLRPSSNSGRTCTAFYSNHGSQNRKTSEQYMNAHSIGREPKSANARGRRRQRNVRAADNDTEAVHSSVSPATEKSAADNRHVKLSFDVVRSVPSNSSAVYPSRQRPARSRKETSTRKGNVFDMAFDPYDYRDDYDHSDEEEMDCSDEQVFTAPASTVLLTERVEAQSWPEFEDCQLQGPSSCVASSACSGVDPATTAGRTSGTSLWLPSGKSRDVLCICGGKHAAKKKSRGRRGRARPQAADGACLPIVADSKPPDAQATTHMCSGSLPVTVHIPCAGDGDGDVMQQLSRNFGEQYSECRCQPRTCLVELRTVARRVAQGCRCRRLACQLSAYLVVQQQNTSPDTYSVWLSANLKSGVELGALSSGATYTVPELVDCVEAFLISLPHDRFSATADAHGPLACSKRRLGFDLLSSVRGWSVVCQTLDDVEQELVNNVARLHEENERNAKATSENLVLIPAVAQRSLSTCKTQCGSCFEDVGGAGIKAVALTECGHSFCLDCWRAYLAGKVAEGQTLVQCPEYRCCALVDHATMLAICGPDVTTRYRMQQAEVMVWKQGNVKWCPNPYCKRLVRVQCQNPQAAGHGEAVCISCACGMTFCFDCLSEPHWPLTCQQAGSYHSMLKRQGLFMITSAKESIVHVQTKSCPVCHYPIEKWMGCNHMHCSRCETHFCWLCLTVLPPSNTYEHVNACRLTTAEVQAHEFTSALRWSYSSSRLSQATSNRVYKSMTVVRSLERKLSDVLGRTKLATIKEYQSHVCTTCSSKFADQIVDVRKHLEHKLIAFKLDAHHIVEYTHICLAMGAKTNASGSPYSETTVDEGAATSVTATTMQTKMRVQAELGRLAFVLEQAESMLELLSTSNSPRPNLHQLLHLDGMVADGRRSLQSLIRLIATYLGY